MVSELLKMPQDMDLYITDGNMVMLAEPKSAFTINAGEDALDRQPVALVHSNAVAILIEGAFSEFTFD